MQEIVSNIKDQKAKDTDDDTKDVGMYHEIVHRTVNELNKSAKFMIQLQLNEVLKSHRKLSILNKVKKYVGEANLKLHKLVYGAKTKSWKSHYNLFKEGSHTFAKSALTATQAKIDAIKESIKNLVTTKGTLEEAGLEDTPQQGGSKNFMQTLNELKKINKKLLKEFNQYGGLLKKNKRSLNKSRKRSKKSRKRRR